MYCSKCGTQFADGAAFCPSCGAATQLKPAQQVQAQPNVGQFQAQPNVGQAPAQPYAAQAQYAAFTCPFCKFQGPPMVTKKLSGGGWALFVVLLIVFFPICWLPWVIDGCKEEVRKCAACGTTFG